MKQILTAWAALAPERSPARFHDPAMLPDRKLERVSLSKSHMARVEAHTAFQ